MASSVLAFVVAAFAQAVACGQGETAASLDSLRGTVLAEGLMEEILSLPYDDPNGYTAAGPDTGNSTRQLYDNIDDYHGFSETANNIKDLSAALYPREYQCFTRSVTCVYGSVTPTGLGVTLSGITVTVTVTQSPGSLRWTITRFIPDPS